MRSFVFAFGVSFVLLSGIEARGEALPYAYFDSVVTVTNPFVSGTEFGKIITRVGNSRIAVAEPAYEPPGNSGGPYGAVMIFDLSGALQTVITNAITEQDADIRNMDLAERSDSSFFVSRPIRTLGDSRGVVYALDVAGNLLDVIANPVSSTQSDVWFGNQIQRVSPNLFLVSTLSADPVVGIAANCETQRIHAIDIDGNTLIEMRRYMPCDSFGELGAAMAAIPGERFMIATYDGTTPGVDLYDASGTLLKSLAPPTEFPDDFGRDVQVLNTNLFVIAQPTFPLPGGSAGRVRMYDRDGNFLRKIDYPERYAGFGAAVAPLSEDIFAVGAPEAPVSNAGAVFLFNTQGTFLQHLTPPGPGSASHFGSQVFGAGTNRLVVASSGKVYIYELSFGLSDRFEPDNAPSQARAFAVGQEQTHSFHSPGDQDWIRFYLTTNYSYFIQTDTDSTNVNVVLDLFFQHPNGALTQVVTNFNQNPRQANGLGGEFLFFTPTQSGNYLCSAKNSNPEDFGEDNAYDLKVSAAAPGFTALAIVAVDLLSPGGQQSPPGTVIVIDGGTPVPMHGANTMVFTEPDIAAGGTHTVEVRVPPGYLSEQDPVEQDSVANPLNPLFGNPKLVNIVANQWNFYVYAFTPGVQVSGRLRDGATGGWLDGATLSFEAAGGALSGLVYAQYPFAASYVLPWQTDAGGAFPTNVIIPNGDWHFRAFREDFGWIVISNMIRSLGPGVTTNLNLPSFTPKDANANGIADAWELKHFFNFISGLGDFDGDGHSDRLEYLLGTDPRKAANVLSFNAGTRLPQDGPLTFAWPVAGGRSYGIRSTPSLTETNWVSVFGPWTAPSNGTMTWQATNLNARQLYRLDVFLP